MIPTVDVQHVVKRFGAHRAVDDVSLVIRPGEITGLLGPNGAGKTTTIRMILDIFPPDAGSIHVFGEKMTPAARGRIGYLPEERGLYKDERVRDCLHYLALLKGLDSPTARARADAYLSRVGLESVARKKIKELSKGMQQKVQLGVALLHEPDLVIVDEPFYGLDPVNTDLVKALLREAAARGAAVVMCSHQMDRVEELCARIGMFDGGKLVLSGSVREIRRQWSHHVVVVQGRADWARVPGLTRWTMSDERTAELWLQAETDPQDVLRALTLDPSARIERFEIADRSLHDIFIAVVSGGRPPDEADRLGRSVAPALVEV